MENLTGGTPPVRYLPCVVPCKLYFGRGLRKAENKEYVVILDFIGNYNNNFMIPVALSGDRTYNADTIRKYVNVKSCACT